MQPNDFDDEFRAKIDTYLKEGVEIAVDGGFDAFCLADTFDKYALAHNLTANELVHVVKEVFRKRTHRLVTDKSLGISHTVQGLVDNLLVALSSYAADKQAKVSAAEDPADDVDMDGDTLPPANANSVINGLECPPPSSLLKHMLRGKTDPAEVMQLTSLYFREFGSKPSNYANAYYDNDSTVSKISHKSTGKSTSKSRSPECFYGKSADHGYSAKSWIFAFQLYLAAEDEHNPVAKAATYLRGDALDWWQQSGYLSMPPDADFEQFSTAFLKRFVKPADSAKARRELPLLKQEGQSVETYAAKLNNMNNRIIEGTALDSTTLAVYFQQGLTRRISSALVDSQSIATMQDLALVIAADEEIESKLDLSVKQAQLEVPAPGNPNPNERGRFNNKGAEVPALTSPPTIVVLVEGPSMLAGAMLPGAEVPV